MSSSECFVTQATLLTNTVDCNAKWGEMLDPFGNDFSSGHGDKNIQTVQTLHRKMLFLKRLFGVLSVLTAGAVLLGLVVLRNVMGNGMIASNPIEMMEKGSVSSNYLSEAVVTATKLAADSVLGYHLAPGAVSSAYGSSPIAEQTLTADHFSNHSVSTQHLADFTHSSSLRSPNLPQILFDGRSSSFIQHSMCRLDSADRLVCLDTADASGSLKMLRCKDYLCWAGYDEFTVNLDGFNTNKVLDILDFRFVGSMEGSALSDLPVILYSRFEGVYISQCVDAECTVVGPGVQVMEQSYNTGTAYAKLGSTDNPAYFSYVASDGSLKYAYGSCAPLSANNNYKLDCTDINYGYFTSVGLGMDFKSTNAGQFVVTAGLNEQEDYGWGITVALWDSTSTNSLKPRASRFTAITGIDKLYDVVAYKDLGQYGNEVLRIRVTVGQLLDNQLHTYAYSFCYQLDSRQLESVIYESEEYMNYPYGMYSVVDFNMAPIQVGQYRDGSCSSSDMSCPAKLMFTYGRPKSGDYQTGSVLRNQFSLKSLATHNEKLSLSILMTRQGYPMLVYAALDGPLYATRCTNKLCQVHLN
eukprot:g10836.t1